MSNVDFILKFIFIVLTMKRIEKDKKKTKKVKIYVWHMMKLAMYLDTSARMYYMSPC